MAFLEATSRLGNYQSLLKPWVPSSTAIRWRSRKPNIQRPAIDHYVKARYKAAMEPFYPNEMQKPWYEICGNNPKQDLIEEKDNRYRQLLANLFYERFAESQAIGIFQRNPTTGHEEMKIKQMLHGHNMKMVVGSINIATMALAGTIFEPVLKLHMSGTVYLCSKELTIAKMLKFAKKMETHVLLGGIVQGRLVTKNHLIWCSKLPNIDTLRAELCHILSSPSIQLNQILNHQQQTLSQSLEQHAKQTEDPTDAA